MLETNSLRKSYSLAGGRELVALDGVSVKLVPGASTALVGESGCGKSTLAKLLLRLEEPSGGEVLFEGTDIWRLNPAEVAGYRRKVQMIFQDPYGSLNPRMKVGDIVGEPFEIHGTAKGGEKKRKVLELLERVGLGEDAAGRYPRQFSGGQRQRIGIARALAVEPRLLVADEPVSALDVSVQAQVLELISELRRERGLGLLFISHDLRVVRVVSDYALVMYLGKIVESAPTEVLFNDPLHPYTEVLLEAAPVADPHRKKQVQPFAGDPPSPIDSPKGCPFHTRCKYAFDPCYHVVPKETVLEGGRTVRCFKYEEKRELPCKR
jgi:oligopeptide/dipeptide ABC transporter ATP-binding protein